jgi:hypothetical protein
MDIDFAAVGEAFRRDGAVHLEAALDPDSLAQALEAYDWSLANPGPGASRFKGGDANALFYQDLYNPGCLEAYRHILLTSNVADITASVWGAPDVWFMYEQVFLKEGGESRRTPWHQDSSYLTVAGEHLMVMWITFDAIPREDSLEFVRGSHRGVLYNGSRFDPDDDTAPLHETDAVPRLPDIQADRSAWDIVSWGVEPGDVVLFHPATLHGGAPTHPGGRRRTLTLRFFGERAYYDKRPGPAGPRAGDIHARLSQGDPFRDPSFLKLRPRSTGRT